MVTVEINGYDVHLKGHARSGNKGVCTMISTLCITLRQSLEKLTQANFEACESYGEFYIKFIEEPQNDAQILMRSFFIGIEEIVKDFPVYVRVTKH